jgi:hypothetical protein
MSDSSFPLSQRKDGRFSKQVRGKVYYFGRFAVEARDLDALPRFGRDFRHPTQRAIRQERHASGPNMLDAATIRKMLDRAECRMRAAILLGVNAGFGTTDIGTRPIAALDLVDGGSTSSRSCS